MSISKLQPASALSPLSYLKVHQLGNVGISDEHLMQQTADETLHLPQIAEQAPFHLRILYVSAASQFQAALF